MLDIIEVTDQEIVMRSLVAGTLNCYEEHTIITKEAFIKAYKKWILGQTDKPLHYYSTIKRGVHTVIANTEEWPEYDTNEYVEEYEKKLDKFVNDSIVIGEFYTQDVADRVCDELNAREVLKWK